MTGLCLDLYWLHSSTSGRQEPIQGAVDMRATANRNAGRLLAATALLPAMLCALPAQAQDRLPLVPQPRLLPKTKSRSRVRFYPASPAYLLSR